jgi:hypothetical protein
VQIYKFASGFAFAAAALTTVVLLAVFGNADVAVVVAVAAGLVGMYVLRHHARARLIYDARPPSAGDPSEPESRRQARTAEEGTGPNRTGTMTGPFY